MKSGLEGEGKLILYQRLQETGSIISDPRAGRGSHADLRAVGALILQSGQDETPPVLETIPLWVESGQVRVSLYTSHPNIKSPVFPPQAPRQGQHHTVAPARSQRPYGVSLGGVLATCPPRPAAAGAASVEPGQGKSSKSSD